MLRQKLTRSRRGVLPHACTELKFLGQKVGKSGIYRRKLGPSFRVKICGHIYCVVLAKRFLKNL